MSTPNAHLTPADEARVVLLSAAAACVDIASTGGTDEQAAAAEGALDLAAIRLVAELEAEQGR